jgi:hypothetical protein
VCALVADARVVRLLLTARRAEDVLMHDRDRCRYEMARTTQDPIKDLAE